MIKEWWEDDAAKKIRKETVASEVKERLQAPKPFAPKAVGGARISAFSGKPYAVPENAKWSTLFAWAEQIREAENAKGKNATVTALANLIRHHSGWPTERCNTAHDRLRVIYEQDHQTEQLLSAAYAKRPDPEVEPEKAKGAAPKAAKIDVPKMPGVIATIIEELTKASKKKPATRESILKRLVAVRPDRNAESMSKTIAAQVPKGLLTEKKIVVSEDGKGGYWIKTKES